MQAIARPSFGAASSFPGQSGKMSIHPANAATKNPRISSAIVQPTMRRDRREMSRLPTAPAARIRSSALTPSASGLTNGPPSRSSFQSLIATLATCGVSALQDPIEPGHLDHADEPQHGEDDDANSNSDEAHLERATHTGAHLAAVWIVRSPRAFDASGFELRPVVRTRARAEAGRLEAHDSFLAVSTRQTIRAPRKSWRDGARTVLPCRLPRGV